MRRESHRNSRVRTHRPKENIHDIIIRYAALISIVALFVMDIHYKVVFDHYAEAYASLGIFILFGKQDLLAILKTLKKW